MPKLDPEWYLDMVGLVLNGVTISCTLLGAVIPFLFCLAGVDTANVVFPVATSIIGRLIHFTVRLIIWHKMATEVLSCFCITHMCIIVATLYSKCCLGYLRSYIQPEKGSPRKGHRKTRVLTKSKQSNIRFRGLSDLQLYRIVMILFRITRAYSDTTALFSIGPCFSVVVMFNYVLIKLGGRVPTLLYLTVALFDITVLIIMFRELPQLGKTHAVSKNLIKYWNDTTGTRSSLRRRQVNSLQTVGCWVGNLFLINDNTFAEYFQRILIHSVDATLLL